MEIQSQKKIVDSFLFNKEIELVKDRIKYLYDSVDRFIVVECNYTHTGINKPFYFSENISEFTDYLDKISVFKLTLNSNYDFSNPWNLENYQRDFITECLDDFCDNDIIIVSDADEIPDSSKFKELITIMKTHDLVRLNQKMFYYNLKNRLMSFPCWGASYASTKKYLCANGANNLRLNLRKDTDGSMHSGWHLTYFMDSKQIKEKLESFAHTEYNTEYYKDTKRLQTCIENKIDPFERKDHKFEQIILEEHFTEHFLKCFHRWK